MMGEQWLGGRREPVGTVVNAVNSPPFSKFPFFLLVTDSPETEQGTRLLI